MQQEENNLNLPQNLETPPVPLIPQVDEPKASKPNKKLIFAAGILLIVFGAIIGLTAYIYWQKSKALESDILPVPTPSPIESSVGMWSIVPDYYDWEVELPDFSQIESVPEAEIDTSNWLTYKNDELGFEFKYPPEWGKYEEKFEEHLCGDEYCWGDQDEDDNYWLWSLYFKNTKSYFLVSGASSYFGVSRGGTGYEYFTGFGAEKLKGFCDDYEGILDCRVDSDNKVYISHLYPCVAGPDGGIHFELDYMFTVRNSDKIGGISFVAQWVTENSSVWHWIACEEPGLTQVKKAIEERRFDRESVELLDTYNAVIESVRVY